jgi:sarcosine dehydrogenase
VLAQWVIDGEAPLDLWVVDIRRFSEMHKDRQWVNDRTLEAYGKHYEIGFPHVEYESGRPRIVSPLCMTGSRRIAPCSARSSAGNGPTGSRPRAWKPRDIPTMGRQNWFDAVGDEHRHVREKVGIFDQSSFAKYEVSGPDALAALSHICANDVTKPVGRLTYTQLLNTRGGIEADLTVARLADDRFYIVTGTGFRTHDLAWIREHMPQGADVRIEDITEDHRHAFADGAACP